MSIKNMANNVLNDKKLQFPREKLMREVEHLPASFQSHRRSFSKSY